MNSSFTVKSSGSIGQEIIDPDGIVIAWTTDTWIAQVIVMLLDFANEHGLLMQPFKIKEGEGRSGWPRPA